MNKIEALNEKALEAARKAVKAAAVYDPVADVSTLADHAIRAYLTASDAEREPVAWQHIPNCGVDRESKMVHVTGKVFCDPCIAPLVAALNAASIETVASCCGHGHRPGVIVLRDGRELFIAKDFEEARKVNAAFPTDINGDARPSEQAATEEMVEAAREIIHGARHVYSDIDLARAALKAAMEAEG